MKSSIARQKQGQGFVSLSLRNKMIIIEFSKVVFAIVCFEEYVLGLSGNFNVAVVALIIR